jgi:redox-sensitive bicupin YhaK (pirin superfamily)
MVKPHFKMLWRESIPVVKSTDGNTKIEVIAGTLAGKMAPLPPPDSWAADPKNEVAVWNLKMEAGAVYTLPNASKGINRTIYFYEGEGLAIAGKTIPKYNAVELQPDVETILKAGPHATSILLLQGRPIAQPVIQYGPFVMNTKEEIQQAFEDYNKTKFGGWPWQRYDHVHPREKGRFARHADGKLEEKG